jgi:hypothetical protein
MPLPTDAACIAAMLAGDFGQFPGVQLKLPASAAVVELVWFLGSLRHRTVLARTTDDAIRCRRSNKSAKHVTRAVRAAILVLTVSIVLVQLIALPVLIRSAFLIVFGGIALSFVLAGGLGSRKVVEAMWEDVCAVAGRNPPTW